MANKSSHWGEKPSASEGGPCPKAQLAHDCRLAQQLQVPSQPGVEAAVGTLSSPSKKPRGFQAARLLLFAALKRPSAALVRASRA